MDCYICHRSYWMKNKVLDFLKNYVNHYNEKICDNDFFIPVDTDEINAMLPEVLNKHLPKEFIDKISETRHRGFLLELDTDPVKETLDGLWNSFPERRSEVRDIINEVINIAYTKIEGKEERDIFKERIMELQKLMGLSERDIDILVAVLAHQENIIWNPMQSRRGSSASQRISLVAKCLAISEMEIVVAVSEKGALRHFRCLDSDLDIGRNLYGFLSGVKDEPLSSNFFSKSTEKTLPWKDFSDLAAKHGKILKRMLSVKDKPVNILLYGAPGTGKTSFAKALVNQVKKNCYFVAQDTETECNASSSTPKHRFTALQICDGQIKHDESVIVIDEADEMLRGQTGFFSIFGGRGDCVTGDKGLLNTVLDEIKTPTIWITNTSASELDPSSRRRFDYSIEFVPLNCEQRKRIWKNNITRMKAGRLFSEEMLDKFSSLYPVSAGGISMTLENVISLKPKRSEVPELVKKFMEPHCELMEVNLCNDKLLPSADYSLDGLNIQGEVELNRIVEAVRAFQSQKGAQDPDRPRMNLLLSGAPGTGKTEFVKYLGKVLNTKVQVCMGSDLLSMWVGGTEQNIKKAFEQAEAEHSILFLDEIDGLVQNRSAAKNNWEVTQVNELLHQMENFNGVMVGATNFLGNLDPAIMRRFTFKLAFEYLDCDGKAKFFERMFKTKLAADEKKRLDEIPCLAPGDFRTVRQSLFYYGGDITNKMRLDALQRESEAKGNNAFAPKAAIGF